MENNWPLTSANTNFPIQIEQNTPKLTLFSVTKIIEHANPTENILPNDLGINFPEQQNLDLGLLEISGKFYCFGKSIYVN